ncbi:hypothetical protein BJV77DRAFT_1039011, partial [Russula vinacea]
MARVFGNHLSGSHQSINRLIVHTCSFNFHPDATHLACLCLRGGLGEGKKATVRNRDT